MAWPGCALQIPMDVVLQLRVKPIQPGSSQGILALAPALHGASRAVYLGIGRQDKCIGFRIVEGLGAIVVG